MNKTTMAATVLTDVLAWSLDKKKTWLNENKGICLIFMEEWSDSEVEKYFFEKYTELVHALPIEILFCSYTAVLRRTKLKDSVTY